MDGVQIKQLTIHTQQEPLQTQLRVERLLRTMRLQPPGMLESEFLFVRHLRIDVPLDTRSALDTEWERLVQDRLSQYAQQAYRPPMGEPTIPLHHQSIYFPDAVHLLTCLTQALIYQAEFLNSWLLHNVLPYQALSLASALAMLWSAHIRALPKITHYLSAHTLNQALQRFDDKALNTILLDLHHAYGVTNYLSDFHLAPDIATGVPDFARTVTQRYFLTLCEVLRVRPSFAQSATFESTIQGWLRQWASPTYQGSVDDEGQPYSPLLRNMTTSIHHNEEERENLKTSPFDAHPTATQLGGIFYLIHYLSWLGLPTDAQRPYVGAWAMIESLARVLLADHIEQFSNDALWSLLPLLDQRAEDAAIGEGWRAPEAYHVPIHWLADLDQAHTWVFVRDAEHIRFIDHRRGYLVADMHESQLDPFIDALDQAGLEIALLDPAHTYPEHSRPHTFAEWLKSNKQLFIALIARRLNMPFAEFDPVTLLHKPATIYLSNTHIDVVQHINNIDMRVRRSGWDIDPGWRPDLGYIVYFHFVEG